MFTELSVLYAKYRPEKREWDSLTRREASR
jgi:hypothetical protein